MRRALSIVVVCTAVVVVTMLVWPRGGREPVYQGKRLSEWIKLPEGKKAKAERVAAIEHIGTNALPFLIKWIAVCDMPKQSKVQVAVSKASKGAGRVLEDFRMKSLNAANDSVAAFWVLGERGSPAIPDLVQLARGTNFTVSVQAIHALEGIGKSAVPALTDLPESPGAPVWVSWVTWQALESVARRASFSSRTNAISGKSN
jgi:hypothetical protein